MTNPRMGSEGSLLTFESDLIIEAVALG